MSKDSLCPSTIEGIKTLAKEIKSEEGLKHFQALNRAAEAGGFRNFTEAQRMLAGDRPAPKPQHIVYLSAQWHDRATGERGQEVLLVRLWKPLSELLTPAQLTYTRYLAVSTMAASDHLVATRSADSKSDARRWACGTARTLQFADATGLRPSSAKTRGFPEGEYRNRLPGCDHDSVWYDPKARAHVFVDEPYTLGRETSAQRQAWADRHGWELVQPVWPGMYNPDWGCHIYLAADTAKGYSLAPIVEALDALPPPPMELKWTGRSVPASPAFLSPAAIAKLEAAKEPKPPRTRGPATSVTYRSNSGKIRRRPKGRLPIETHMEVGRLLQDAIAATWMRPEVRSSLELVRTTLDDWVQFEYDRNELSSEDFSEMYYGADVHVRPSKKPPENREAIKLTMDRASALLEQGYPASPPLSSILKSIDAARNALLRW